MPRVFAISDLHVGNQANFEALAELPRFADDWLIVAGDVGERPAHLRRTLDLLAERFARLIWVPGNHDLWTLPRAPGQSRGVERYEELVEICRRRGVATPEDEFPVWRGEDGQQVTIAPLFVLYDYSFRPAEVTAERVLEWSLEHDILCADEALLHPDPYPSRQAWCRERVAISEQRLTALGGQPVVLVNHFPLRYDMVRLRLIPRFSPWCGTRQTEDWHRRFGAVAVVYGHLHIRASRVLDGVRFEEVSLGYPRDWRRGRGVASYLRQILPTSTESVAESISGFTK